MMKRNMLAVLSTVDSQNKPESAVLAFAEHDDLTVIFGTSDMSRKYKNLVTNPRISLVIGWGDDGTVQYEGEAVEVPAAERDAAAELLIAKNKCVEKFINKPDERLFVVRPSWIRLVDMSNGFHQYELTF